MKKEFPLKVKSCGKVVPGYAAILNSCLQNTTQHSGSNGSVSQNPAPTSQVSEPEPCSEVIIQGLLSIDPTFQYTKTVID